jgi:hypothetical protein
MFGCVRVRAPCVCVCGYSCVFERVLVYARTHTLIQIHAERYTMNVCTHVLSAHVSVGTCSSTDGSFSSRSTQGHVWIAGYTRPFPLPTHLLLYLAKACPSHWHFSRKLSTCRRHRHGRPVLLVPILILHARVPTRSRSHKSDLVCMRLSLEPIPSLLACAKVRASARAYGRNEKRLREVRGARDCLHFAVRGARDCLRSVAPDAGHRAKNTPHAASGRSDATLALIRSGRPTKNHLLQVRAFSARCDDQEGTHARARAGAHRATITAQ